MTNENELVPSREMIAERAYERYCQRGREDGHETEDWLAAEIELRAGLAEQHAQLHGDHGRAVTNREVPP
jgi:Protein of unknown function (DUF2934)